VPSASLIPIAVRPLIDKVIAHRMFPASSRNPPRTRDRERATPWPWTGSCGAPGRRAEVPGTSEYSLPAHDAEGRVEAPEGPGGTSNRRRPSRRPARGTGSGSGRVDDSRLQKQTAARRSSRPTTGKGPARDRRNMRELHLGRFRTPGRLPAHAVPLIHYRLNFPCRSTQRR